MLQTLFIIYYIAEQKRCYLQEEDSIFKKLSNNIF